MSYYLVSKLPEPLRPYAKAVAAAIASLLVLIVNGLFTGEFDWEAIRLAVGTLIITLFVFQTPNLDQQPVEGTHTITPVSSTEAADAQRVFPPPDEGQGAVDGPTH